MSKVFIKFYSDIRGLVGTDSINMEIEEGETINNLISHLCKKFSEPFSKVIYEPKTNKLNKAVIITKNHINITLLEGLDTKILDGDEITLFAAVSGG